MKTDRTVILATLIALAASLSPFAASKATAKGSSSTEDQSAVSVGIEYHSANPAFEGYPYGDGDLSYGLAYEVHNQLAYWQFAVSYAPNATGTNTIDSVITPELNLITKDTFWRGGIGILNSYAPSNVEGADDWLGFYGHFILGVGFDLGKIGVDLHAYYPFSDFGELSEFDTNGIEYGAWIRYVF